MNSVVPLHAGVAKPTFGATPALVRTIDLTTVRIHVGPKFAAIVDQLHARLRQDFQQMLGTSGSFNPIGDLFYLVVLWGMNEEAAAELLQRMLKRVHAHLRELKVDTAGLFIPVNAAHLDRRGRPKVDAIQSLEEGDDEPARAPLHASVAAEERSSFAFEPVWNVRQGVVSAFRCVRMGSSSTATNADAPVTEMAEWTRLASQDQGMLRHAIAEWAKLPADAVCLMIVPVHFETLAGAASRRDYLNICGTIPTPLKRLMIFEIEQLPDGAQTGLLEIARYMKPFCRAATARVSFEYQGFDAIQKAGIQIVACHVGGTRSEQQCLQLMERFVERAEKYKLQTGVYGIRSVSLTTAALAAGFVYIGGEAVSTLAETPRGLFKFDMADVYRSQMDA